jgi:hypothetical protein
MTVNKLEVVHSLEASETVSFQTYLRGTTQLHDYDISIIGEPVKRAVELQVTFLCLKVGQEIELVERLRGSVFSTPLGAASIGFMRADWEINTEDKWWLSCYLEKPNIEELIRVVSSGILSSMTLSVLCKNLYQDIPPLLSGYDGRHLFLRPSETKHDWPVIADGALNEMNFSSSKVDMSPLLAIDELVEEPHDSEAIIQPKIDPVVITILKLNESVMSLIASVKWFGGFLVLALIFFSKY